MQFSRDSTMSSSIRNSIMTCSFLKTFQQHTVTKNSEINEDKSPKLPFAHFKHWFNMTASLTTANSKKVQPCELYEQVYINIDLKFILVIVLARIAALDGWRVVSIKLLQLLKIFQWPQRLKGLKWSYMDNPADHGSDICTLNNKRKYWNIALTPLLQVCVVCVLHEIPNFVNLRYSEKKKKGKKNKKQIQSNKGKVQCYIVICCKDN